MDRTGRPPEIEPTPTDVSVLIRSSNVVGEAPLWDPPTQQLYLVDIPGQLIHIFRPTDGDHRTFDLPDWVTSVSTRAQGGLVLSMRKNFAFYDVDSGDLEILADPEPERTGNRFNDGKCDRQGRLWAGTMGAEDWLAPTGALYRFDPDGRITRMHDEVKCSNGIGWSPDGRVMYHTESFRYAIFAFDFDPDSGEIEAHGPVDEPHAFELAGELRVALAADAELREIGVLILPLQPIADRSIAAPRPPADE